MGKKKADKKDKKDKKKKGPESHSKLNNALDALEISSTDIESNGTPAKKKKSKKSLSEKSSKKSLGKDDKKGKKDKKDKKDKKEKKDKKDKKSKTSVGYERKKSSLKKTTLTVPDTDTDKSVEETDTDKNVEETDTSKSDFDESPFSAPYVAPYIDAPSDHPIHPLESFEESDGYVSDDKSWGFGTVARVMPTNVKNWLPNVNTIRRFVKSTIQSVVARYPCWEQVLFAVLILTIVVQLMFGSFFPGDGSSAKTVSSMLNPISGKRKRPFDKWFCNLMPDSSCLFYGRRKKNNW